MPAIQEAKSALGAVMRLSVFDRSGASGLQGGMEACARSFWACVLALPAFYIPLGFELSAGPGVKHLVPALIARSLAYVIGCAAFPLALLPLLGWLDQAGRWPKLIFGYNWLSLLQNCAVLVLVLLDHAGLFGGNALSVYVAFYILCLAAEGFMFALVLEMGVLLPIGLVLIDLIIGELIDGVARTVQ
jgi:hypothetical protein